MKHGLNTDGVRRVGRGTKTHAVISYPEGTKIVKTFACTILSALILSTTLVAAEPLGTIHVDGGADGVVVSPQMYGLFFEEINHSGDGGLYAELVRNRGLEDTQVPQGMKVENGRLITPNGWRQRFRHDGPMPGWSLAGEGSGSFELDDQRPLNEATPHSLRLKIDSIEDGRVGVANSGYWGMSIKEGEAYDLSLYARCNEDFEGSLVVTLESVSGAVYAEAKIDGLQPQWNKLDCTLKSNATDPKARLVICAPSTGTIWLDMVSLFPQKTWKNRPGGLRPDLAQMLADIQPGFLRFPGGCVVEGITLDNRVKWKETIGPLATRPGHWIRWGYRTTDGLGYHEFLQMAEDFGCPAMFVCNVGMSCQFCEGEEATHDELDAYIQDTLDAIEYALGTVDSTWGAKRAENGHPEPFNLKYVEIGNENFGATYEKHYRPFFEAIKQRYPQITTIACTAPFMRLPLVEDPPFKDPTVPIEIADEHFYVSPDWFMSHADRYDGYDRGGPKVYVGEYACNKGVSNGTFWAALAEAAFMTGMERNADVVRMGSYAPIFINNNDSEWSVDMIGFDSSRSYGRSSYYVQKLFGAHRPDVALPTRVTSGTRQAKTLAGKIGLATWKTQAEFKELSVQSGGIVLFTPDFRRGMRRWKAYSGRWVTEDGLLKQLDRGEFRHAAAGSTMWKDYTLKMKARKIDGQEGFTIIFCDDDGGSFLLWNSGGWGNTQHGVDRIGGNPHVIPIGQRVPGSIETGRWYDIRIELDGTRVRCYLDGKRIHDIQVDTPASPELFATAGRDRATAQLILKVVNVADHPYPTDVTINGIERLAAEGTALVLHSPDPTAENSLEHPTKIAPATESVTGLGPKFRYTFKPYSMTVLRIDTTNVRKN